MGQNSKGTNSAPKKPRARWGTSTASFYADYEGKTITVHLVMGDELRGVLVGVDTYDIFVEREGETTVLVAKHAISWIEPAR